MKLNIKTLLLETFIVLPFILFAQASNTQTVRVGSIYGDKKFSNSKMTPEALEADKYVQKGRNCRDLKHYDSAIFYFQKALELTPKDGITYYRKAYVEQQLYYYKDALADYNSALKYAPYQANLFFNRAFVNIKLKNYQASIDDYTVEINKWSRYTNAYINRAIAKRSMGRFKESIDEYDTVLGIWPNSTLALSNRAWVNLYLGDTVSGMAGLNRLFSINPNFKRGLDNKIFAIYNNANYEECITEADNIIAKFNELQRNYFTRGKAKYNLHRYTEAIADYNKTLEEFQNDPARLDGDHEKTPI